MSEMQKNILAVSDHGELTGGGEHSFIDLMVWLKNNGFTLLALVPFSGDVEKRLIHEGIWTELLFLPRMRPWRLFAVITVFLKGMGICRKNKIDIIYANGSRACLYWGCIGRILHIPVVWHCRIASPEPFFDAVLCGLSTCIVANSRATANRFKCRAEKIKLVYNGLDIKWLQNRNVDLPEEINPEHINLLILARLSRWKRHDLALRAFERIAAGNDRVNLYCVGGVDRSDPTWRDELIHMSRTSRFCERIHWIDAVGDVRPWLRAATILLLPSDNEPFGRVIVEAMACSVPVVATRGGGVPEIITEGINGLMVPCGDADAMAGAIERILVDDDLRQRLIDAGLKRARDFSMEALVQSMAAVFNGVCAE